MTVQHIPGKAHSRAPCVPFLSARQNRPPASARRGKTCWQCEQAKMISLDPAIVRHNFYRIQPGLLLQKPFQYKMESQRPRNYNAMETGVLIGDSCAVIPRHRPKYLRFGKINHFNRCDKTHTICRQPHHLPSTRERRRWLINQPCISGDQRRFCPEIIFV